VNLSGNKISSFPAGFKGINVEALNMNENSLTQFPEEFSSTGSIINFLQVSHNKIDTVTSAAISNLKSLKAFECQGNKLRFMPFDFNVEQFPYMTGIDLSRNQFSRFPMEILYVNYLTQLMISHQFDHNTGKRTLTEWPDGIQDHPALRVFDISGNDIRKVTKFPVMLNYLDIHDNPNIYITVPQEILVRLAMGTFKLVIDEDQNVEGI
ncbi:MAG: leucine-rich repeat domain-containing protein, partial [Bacteroidales bacterium]